MKKIINNKYSIFLLLFLYDWVAFAHDCSSPGDCEETAGYNSAVAIVGGVIAVAVGVMSSGMTPNVPPVDEDVVDSDQEVTNEELDDFIDEIDDTDEEMTDEEIEDLFDDEDLDDFMEEIDDTDEELTDEEIEELFEDEDLDDFIDDTDEEIKEIKEEIDKATTEKELDEVTTKETSSGDVALDETQKVMDTSNNIKTLLESAGAQGVKLWQGLLKGEEYKKAAQRYKDIIDNCKNKGLNDLANKYASKLNKLLRGKANRFIVTKTKGAKSLFRNVKNIKNLGHLADALTFINNVNKKFKNAKQTDEQVGVIAEEILRVGLKKFLTKNPVIAIGDAILSLSGGPNLDFVIDKSIDTYKEGVTKATEWVYTPKKSDSQKFVEAFQKRKANINKLNISEADKKIRLKKIIKILKNNEALWK